MADKVLHENDDSLVESVGDVIAVGAIGTVMTSRFFRNGYGKDLNNAILATKFELGEQLSYISDNLSDLTQVNRTGFNNAKALGRAKYNRYINKSAALDVFNQSEIQQFAEFFYDNKKEWIRDYYYSDLQNTVTQWVKSQNNIDTNIKRFIQNNIHLVSHSNGDKTKLLAKAGEFLTQEEIDQNAQLFREMFDVLDWRRGQIDINDPHSQWLHNAANEYAGYNRLKGDPTRLYKEQQERFKSKLGRLKRFEFGANVTIAELADLQYSDPQAYKNALDMTSKSPMFGHVTSHGARTYYATDIVEQLVSEYTGSSSIGHFTKQQLSDLGKIEIEGLYFDSTKGVYSLADTERTARAALKEFGKLTSLFKTNEIIDSFDRKNATHIFKAGEYQPGLMELLGKQGTVLDEAIEVVGDKAYRLVNGRPEEIKELSGKFTLIDVSKGTEKTAFENAGLLGELDREKPVNGIIDKAKQWLGGDIEYDPHYKLETTFAGDNFNLFGAFSKNTIERHNLVTNAVQFLDNAAMGADYYSPEVIEAVRMSTGLQRYINFVNNYTREFSNEGVAKLLNSGSIRRSFGAERILQNIQRINGYPEEWAQTALELAQIEASNGFINHDLQVSVQSFMKNQKAERSKDLLTKDIFTIENDSYFANENWRNALKKQLTEEAVLQLKASGYSTEEIFKLINDNFSVQERDIAKDTAAAALFKQDLKYNKEKPSDTFIPDEAVDESIYEHRDRLQNYKDVIESNDSNTIAYRRQLENMGNRRSITETGFDKRNASYITAPHIQVRRSTYGLFSEYGIKDIIADINKGHYDKAFNKEAENLISFGAQLIAGPGDLKHYTGLSHVLYTQASRLNGLFNEGDIAVDFTPFSMKKMFGLSFKLGLNKQDASTTGKILANIAIKRALPFYAAYMALDLADDVTEAITGTSLKGAAANVAGGAYLGVKKITGFIGDDTLKSLSRDNVLFQYWSGDENGEWNSYEEEKEYQENGYSAIRSGRYWTFGSANEMRGGKIAYWEASTRRLWNSNYRDKSLYNDSFWTKWSPERLINPYYMEQLHYEDRPYAISGGLFDDNTPWGVVLNSTIGDVIKPRIRMHTDRLIGGVDVKTIIEHQNAQIRNREGNNNLFYIQSGRLKSMDFMSFGSALDENVTDENRQEPMINGRYESATAINESIAENININAARINAGRNYSFTAGDKIAINAAGGNIFAQAIRPLTSSSLTSISQVNRDIRNKAQSPQQGLDPTKGFFVESKEKNFNAKIEQMYDNADDIADLMSESKVDYLQQMATVERYLGGLYGYINTAVTGWGDTNVKHIATSQDITSGSRRFWDSGIGGFGGDIMEVTRRFIPEYRRSAKVNPLMNTMPDWMPEKFRYGDAMAAVINGEARMPGIGYESLNELHGDIFGNYGSFDRFKILADVAPTSPEYKLWKRIASKTVQDPELKKEMQAIKQRVAKQTKQHTFYNNKYIGRDTEKFEGYITEVMQGGKFKIAGSDEVYKMAGITVKANETQGTQEVLQKYINVGDKVNLIVDSNRYYSRNTDKDESINAAIVINGENVNQQMLDYGDAKKRANDNSVAFTHANHGDLVNLINNGTELLAHADIPILHSRWAKIEDPLENYKDLYIYGTAFQSWDSPIETYLIPNMRKAASSTFWTGFGIATDILRNNLDPQMGGSKTLLELHKKLAGITSPYGATTSVDRASSKIQNAAKWLNRMDRGSLMGDLTTKVLHFGGVKLAEEKERYGRRWGNAATLAYSAIVAPENLGVQLMSWSRLGYLLSDNHLGGKYNTKLALAGAAIGALRYAGAQKLLASDETADTYVPDKVRQRWDMEDYFDRLEYLKYTALYKKAAEKAKEEEGVDIGAILEAQEKEAHEIAKAKREIKDAIAELSNNNTVDSLNIKAHLRERLENMKATKSPVMTGGDYTKSAIMYYNVAKSTMYALDETSNMTDIIRALPSTDREYFMEFVKEKDPEKREEIMKTVSPQLRKALNMLWYHKYDKPESNESYFSSHKLPAPMWKGWNPQIDLADVRAKVIKNQGAMTPSEFGIYNSQYSDPKVINAPNIEYNEGGDGLLMSALGVKSILEGYGLTGVEVNIQPTQDSTLEVMANVIRTVPYRISQGDFANALNY